jgi:hypothetical protein
MRDATAVHNSNINPRRWLPLIVMLAAAGCSSERDEARQRISPEYGADGRLQLLKYDSQGNGKVDTWSYMDGTRVVRIEIDQDGDGRIDRWEHYRPDQRIEKLGFSRRHNGIEDAWSFTGGDGRVERIELSTHQNNVVDRIEHYEHGLMVRAEEDSNGDGAIDKWESYDGQRLASVAFDTLHRGMPDRRLTYSPAGVATLEIDRRGDGRFAPVSSAAPALRGSSTLPSSRR